MGPVENDSNETYENSPAAPPKENGEKPDGLAAPMTESASLESTDVVTLTPSKLNSPNVTKKEMPKTLKLNTTKCQHSPYFMWKKANHSHLMEEYPNLSRSEFTKMANLLWENLDSNIKKVS